MKIYNVVMSKENPQIFKTVEEVISYIEDFIFEYVEDNSDLDFDEEEEDEINNEVDEILTTLKTKLRKAKNREIIMTPVIEDVIVIRVFEM